MAPMIIAVIVEEFAGYSVQVLYPAASVEWGRLANMS